MTIDELLALWAEKGEMAQKNFGVAEGFFRHHFPQLETSPQGYALALDALNRPIPWKTLKDYDRQAMTDVIEITGLYAAVARKALCRTKRPALSDWKTNVIKALKPLGDTPSMHAVMHAALASQLALSEQLTICRNAHPKIWLTFSNASGLHKLLPINEAQRLAMMPWVGSLAKTTNQELTQLLCPTIYPMLNSLLSDEQWGDRADLIAAAIQCTPRKVSAAVLPLPETFDL